MNNKYVCPKCGGRLHYWREILSELRQGVNPKTGNLNKTIKRTISGFADNEGFGCEGCGWSYNTISLTGGKDFNASETFDEVLEDQENYI